MDGVFAGVVWDRLRLISEFEDGAVDRKGKFLYLKWQAAWRLIVEAFPGSSVEFEAFDRVVDGQVITSDVCYYAHSPDKGPTGSVTCILTIRAGEQTFTARHVYPITDYSNRAIEWPNAFEINTARMRAFVKAAAMMGLGLHIFEGDVDERGARLSVQRDATVDAEAFTTGVLDNGYDIAKVKAFITQSRGDGFTIGQMSEGDAAGLMAYLQENRDAFVQ
jgi:hypothetical protein